MRRIAVCWCALTFLSGFPVHAETPELTPLSLSISPALSVPLGADAALYALGGTASIGADYRMPFLPLLFAGAGLRYSYVPLQSVTTLSIIDGSLRAGVRYDLLPQLSVRAYAIGGYYYAFLNNGSPPPAANLLVGGGLSLSWEPSWRGAHFWHP